MRYTAIASRKVCHTSCPRCAAKSSMPAHNSSDTSSVRSLRSFTDGDASRPARLILGAAA